MVKQLITLKENNLDVCLLNAFGCEYCIAVISPGLSEFAENTLYRSPVYDGGVIHILNLSQSTKTK